MADDENLEVRWWPREELPAMAGELRQRIEAAALRRDGSEVRALSL